MHRQSNSYEPPMANIKRLHQVCKALMPLAIQAMEEEYVKPNRVKLTHFWLAEKLGIKNVVAFALLAKVAQKNLMCRRLMDGPIYWDNDLIEVGMVLDLMKKRDDARLMVA